MPRSIRWSGLLYLGVVPSLLMSTLPASSVAELPAFATPGPGDSGGDQLPASCDVPPGAPLPPGCPGQDGGNQPPDFPCDLPPGQTCDDEPQQPSPTPDGEPGQPDTTSDGIPDAGRWRGGPERSGEMPGPGLAAEPQVLWDTPIGSGAMVGTPAVANGLVYLTSGGVVYAYHVESGLLAWESEQISAIGEVEVVGEILYGYTSHGWIYSRNAVDGTAIQAIEHPAAGAESHFLVTDSQIYLAKGAGLAAFDPDTFAERWTFSLPGLNANGLAASGGTVVVGVDGTILALDAASGVQRWRTPLVVTPYQNVTFPYGALQPSIADGMVFVNSTVNELIHALSLTDGREIWSAASPARDVGEFIQYFPYAPVAAGEGALVYPSIYGDLTVLNAQDHTQRWEFKAESSRFGYGDQSMVVGSITVVASAEYRYPTIVDGVVYVTVWVIGSTSTYLEGGGGLDGPGIVNASEDQFVKSIGIAAFSLETGEELWFTNEVHPRTAGVVIVDGLLIGSDADSVFALGGPGSTDGSDDGNDDPEPDDDIIAYLDEVAAHNDELVASVERLFEIISGDELSDADAEEFSDILALWDDAPGTAAGIEVPAGMEDIQAAYEETANAYKVVAAAFNALASAEPESTEAEEAGQAFADALDAATILSASLDDMLSDGVPTTIDSGLPSATILAPASRRSTA